MNGILSASPSTWAVRLTLGAMLMLIVVMFLIIHSTPKLNNLIVALVMFLAGVSLGAVVMAIFGEPESPSDPRHLHHALEQFEGRQ